MVKSRNTEEKILDSARAIFIKRGFDGARMQEIADHAGINKALLHYYFRSKEKLFDAIFSDTFQQLGPSLAALFSSEIPLEVKIWKFVEDYIEVIKKYPQLPSFIINEINVNPERILDHLKFSDFFDYEELKSQLQDEYEKGHIIKVDMEHFVVNILGLTIFPFVGKLIIQKNLKIDEASWEQFIEDRKKVIPVTIMNWLKVNN